MYKIPFTTNELIVIREALHSITIRGTDAAIVGSVLTKVYKGIEKAAKDMGATPQPPAPPQPPEPRNLTSEG